MKGRLIILGVILGIALTFTASAGIRPGSNVRSVVDEFADSHLNTNVNKLIPLLSSDVAVKFCTGKQVATQGQAAIIKLMRQNEGIRQNCTTSAEILASSESMALARVNFVYDDFVVENFLTLERDRNLNWKITRINKFYNDKLSSNALSKK